MWEYNLVEIYLVKQVKLVIVYDVVLNRGNQCDLSSYAREKQLPSSLKFGEYVALSIGGCDAQMVQEIEVKTNFGSYMFGPQN